MNKSQSRQLKKHWDSATGEFCLLLLLYQPGWLFCFRNCCFLGMLCFQNVGCNGTLHPLSLCLVWPFHCGVSTSSDSMQRCFLTSSWCQNPQSLLWLSVLFSLGGTLSYLPSPLPSPSPLCFPFSPSPIHLPLSLLPHFLLPFSFLCHTGGWTQGLVHVREVLCHWIIPTVPKNHLFS